MYIAPIMIRILATTPALEAAATLSRSDSSSSACGGGSR